MGFLLTLCVLQLLLLSEVTEAVNGIFYPYGVLYGDTLSPHSDDGSSPLITLSRIFPFFGRSYQQIFVNNNGDLTFNSAFYSYSPYQFPAYVQRDIIAVFWTDLDNRENGNVSYRQVTSGSLLQRATQDINQYFPSLHFTASWVFIATWDRVAYFPVTGTETSFQVVLISDESRSFVLMNYGIIAPTSRYVQAGYDTISSTHHFTITGSFPNVTNLDMTSNVNVPGRWAFRTDHGSMGCFFQGMPVQLGDSFWSDSTCNQKCSCLHSGLQCQNDPCSFSQVCRAAAFRYSCQTVQRGTCTISGDPHYYTFDGQLFHFQGTCTYVLSQTCDNGLPYYRVEGKNENRGSTRVSWTRLVRVFVYGEEIELVKTHLAHARVNGTYTAAPFSLRNGTIQVYQTGFSLAVSTDFGLIVTYDANHYVRISVPYDYLNATCGLCGNFNNHQEDDFLSASGEVLSSDVDFANSWQAPGDTDPECERVRCAGLDCAICSSTQRQLYSDTDQCGILRDPYGPFAACHSQLPPQTYMESCVYDLCVGGGYQPILCQALNVYATQCQQHGVQPGLWRRQDFCEISCPANSHFQSQGTGCPATCSNPSAPSNCPIPSQESCICDAGFVLSAGECVPTGQCGCTFEGLYYSAGQRVVLDEDCGRLCVCESGVMNCQIHSCGSQEVCGVENGERGCQPLSYSTCWVEGPRRYRTFDGLTFQYPGACGLTLSKVIGWTSLPRFMVTAQKVPRGPDSTDFARILKFQAEGTEISIEMGGSSRVQVDGQLVRLPFSSDSGRIRLYHSSVTHIVVQTDFGVTVQADWPHLLRVTTPGTYNGTLGGLCGNHNGDRDDEFTTPEGSLTNSSQAFGDSWRDGSLSAHCVEPDDSTTQSGQNSNQYLSGEFCGLMSSSDGPFSQCQAMLDPWERITDCAEAMSQAGGNRAVLCEALRNYALLCQQDGITVGNWRNMTSCEPSCPPNSHYELCGTSCPAACPSLSFPFVCTQQCQEGCQCDDGLLLSGGQCVAPIDCGCHSEGRYYRDGQSLWEGESCQRLCTCNGTTGNVRCVPSACGAFESCRIVDGQYGCHPQPHGTCSASGDPHYSTFDGRTFDFQGTCRYVLATVCNSTQGLEDFQVDARNEPWNGLPVSITAEVFISVYGHTVHISNERLGTVQVDGVIRNLPLLLRGGEVSIYLSGVHTVVNADFGLMVSYDGWSVVSITLPSSYRGGTCGLCGNFNGLPGDDFVTRSGVQAASASQFGTDWKVTGNYTCSDGCGESCPICPDQTMAQMHCAVIRASNGPFSFCHSEVDPEPYFSDCVFDLCLSEDRTVVLCQAIQAYVSACQAANARVYPWRQNTPCSIQCPENSHYELCGTECGNTCASNIDANCEQTCAEGCFCDEGYVRSGSHCVPLAQCGCQYDGFYFEIGEVFWTPGCSQRCECYASNDLRCSAASCAPTQECGVREGRLGCFDVFSTCTVTGDPHYFTFDGAVAHFQGTCSYEIARTCGNVTSDELSFRIVATNQHRGNNRVSFVSSLDVWLSHEGRDTHIFIGQSRSVQVDGHEVSIPSAIGYIAGVSFERGFVVLNTSNDLMVHFDGRSTLLVRLGQNHRGSICGMCGNFNGDPYDDKVLPNGDMALTDEEFGDGWKSDISSAGCGTGDVRLGGGEEDCTFRQEYTDLCSVITNTTGPFRDCHLHADPTPYFTSCVYDLCLYTPANGMLCSAVGAYEAACSVLGLQIPEWRPDLLCPLTDPCDELDCTDQEWCGEKNGVYGCFCNEDNNRPDPENYDSEETCFSSSGIMSLSRCQLFENGFPPHILHLNDPSCNGTLRHGRVEFSFNNEDHICGTALMSNGTHFIYENSIQGEIDPHGGVISRERRINLRFCCVYPLSSSISMPIAIHPVESIVRKKLPAGVGNYHVRMTPYRDPWFRQPFSGSSFELEVDQQLYVAVEVTGVDRQQISAVIDSCWATPFNDPSYPVRWNLIIRECPNTDDNTVQLLQNGVSTVSRFTFRMFTFTGNSSTVYLHCQIHLCLRQRNNCTAHCYPGYHQRVRRSLLIHDSASISIGPLIRSGKNTDIPVRIQIKPSKAPVLGGSLLSLLLAILTTAVLG
ncbi:hypothetical protein MATL_G00012210 [Megalops atlanticus]|uniref:Alpha-tectorin n=1 Tax=Megalops atlanticus TaxID=7932 RepID=A0A9D3QH85_MEGAT|nr:hypothetical protein MATL_G00012210 [Megalops atlanticus]